MIGPKHKGHWSNTEGPNCGKVFGVLKSGVKYKVIKEFTDYDGDHHPINEEWTFLLYSFLPHDDGLSIFVSLDGDQEWHIRLQWRIEEQKKIIEIIQEHISQQ